MTTIEWPTQGVSRIPYAVYSDSELYARELQRFFYRGHWCYIGLEAEIPQTRGLQTFLGRRAIGDHGA